MSNKTMDTALIEIIFNATFILILPDNNCKLVETKY